MAPVWEVGRDSSRQGRLVSGHDDPPEGGRGGVCLVGAAARGFSSVP